MEIFGISLPALMSQLLLGLVNGSFYAILSLGLAVIFGLNFLSLAVELQRPTAAVFAEIKRGSLGELAPATM